MIITQTRSVFLTPFTTEPAWSSHVERWYQLDAPAYALCENYWNHKDTFGASPEFVVLNSPQASLATDRLFCKTLSPSKFVHTLPSVRTSSLFQLMNWRGPALSFVDTFENSREHAEALVRTRQYKHVWFLHISEKPELAVDWLSFQMETSR